jgi:hypothetical protein
MGSILKGSGSFQKISQKIPLLISSPQFLYFSNQSYHNSRHNFHLKISRGIDPTKTTLSHRTMGKKN